MAKIVHIANTDVEFEMARSTALPLERSWTRHSICLQLQYLPLLYAQPDELVAVTALPEQEFLRSLTQTGWWPEGLPQLVPFDLFDSFRGHHCLSWGHSREVKRWIEVRKMSYKMPADWDMICRVNSKEFSFGFTTLPEAALLSNENELMQWFAKVEGCKVIKTCYGLSGVGNRLAEGNTASPELLEFCRKEWRHQRPVIGEPWLERLLDFSTQWKINPEKQIEWIGATKFETDQFGTYQGTLAGPEELLFGASRVFLQQHIEYVGKALKQIAEMGFFGSIGFDALLYRNVKDQSVCLYPIVEINGRQTMSLVALRMQQRLCPEKVFKLSFQQNEDLFPSLLPNKCPCDKGRTVHFRRRLTAQILP